MSIIAAFKGSKSSIPQGWYLCDGNNGTPNLVDRFVKGAEDFSAIGSQGGGQPHTHTLSNESVHSHTTSGDGSHTHTCNDGGGGTLRSGYNMRSLVEATHNHVTTSSTGHTHGVSQSEMLPPYFTLCFITTKEYNWNFPIGSIIMYSGTSEELPSGWHMCDGGSGTLDLRNKFIKGALTKGSTGGNTSHTHTTPSGGAHMHTIQSTSFSHTHSSTSGTVTERGEGTRGLVSQGPSHTHTIGSTGAHSHTVSEGSNDPPYYKLAFIQKIA